MEMPKPSEDDKEYFRSILPGDPDVEVKPMFGNLGAFVHGNMFAGLFGSSVGVKLAGPDAAELAAVEGAGPFGPAERPMGGYLSLPSGMDPDLAARWVDAHTPAAWTNAALGEFERQTHKWAVFPAGTEGYGKAEVTVGGVDTDELSAKTMESRKVPGLFCIGEVVDVTGHLGGFNFQWAWASGACAGRAL